MVLMSWVSTTCYSVKKINGLGVGPLLYWCRNNLERAARQGTADRPHGRPISVIARFMVSTDMDFAGVGSMPQCTNVVCDRAQQNHALAVLDKFDLVAGFDAQSPFGGSNPSTPANFRRSLLVKSQQNSCRLR